MEPKSIGGVGGGVSLDEVADAPALSDAKPVAGPPDVPAFEPWYPTPGDGVRVAAEPAGDAQSPQALAAQQARDTAQTKLVDRAMGELGEAFDKQATAMMSSSSGSVNAKNLEASVALARLQTRPAVAEALRTVPEGVLREAVKDELSDRLPPEKVDAAAELVMQHLRAGAKSSSALRMAESVIGKLTSAAGSFAESAKDPKALDQLCAKLAALEAKGASAEQRSEAAVLRAGFGLPEGQAPVAPAQLATALTARAQLMSNEAKELKENPQLTFRALLTHDVSEVYQREAGITRGSVASQSIRDVRLEGESQEKALERAKLATSVGLAIATGVAGLGALGAMGAAAANGAPSVLVGYHEVESAAAGASAGTASPDAAGVARERANTTRNTALAEVMLAGALSSFGHHVAHGVGHNEVVHQLVHGAEWATHGALGAAIAEREHQTLPELGGASGRDALKRAAERAP